MFKDFLKLVDQLSVTEVSIPVEPDDKGYLDRQCPSETCEFFFKVNADDWGKIVKNEAVWCPSCRYEAPPKRWISKAHVEHAAEQALSFVKGKVHNALVSSAREFNQVQPKNSFISMKMTVSDIPVTTTVIPAQAAEAMQLEIDCEQCQTRFAVIGSAYFCPGCGHNSVTRTYSDSLHKITVKLDCLDIVRKDIVKSMGKDKAELICRSILESCLSDGVVAFQKYCDGLYARYGTPPQNVFQRIDQGSDLWTKAIGKGYDNWQTPDELAELKVLYQKRHILAHNEGIVDQQYLVKSGDTIYKNGQRIVVAPRDVQALLGHLGRLGAGLKTACDKQGLAKS